MRGMAHLQQGGLFLAAVLWSCIAGAGSQDTAAIRERAPRICVSALPSAVRQTLIMIRQGPPFAYKKDGAVFGNHEGLLPKHRRGYYHEFTVAISGSRNRGMQRLIVGGTFMAPQDVYYTADHYASFSRVQE